MRFFFTPHEKRNNKNQETHIQATVVFYFSVWHHRKTVVLLVHRTTRVLKHIFAEWKVMLLLSSLLSWRKNGTSKHYSKFRAGASQWWTDHRRVRASLLEKWRLSKKKKKKNHPWAEEKSRLEVVRDIHER
jgi:hypothetical protein